MAKITNYSTLRSEFQSYFKRKDALSSFDGFLALAEADIWEGLRVREMEARATASTSTTVRFVDVPDGFIKLRRLQILIDDHYVDLDQVPLKDLQIRYSAGRPASFSVADKFEFDRVSDQAYTIEIHYFRELEGVTSTNPTSTALTKYPMIYLAGILKHAYQWALQEDKSLYWNSVFEREIAKANRKARQGRYGPAPAKRISGGVV